MKMYLLTVFSPDPKPFYVTGHFLYTLKTSTNPEIFWCFQGVQKETSDINNLTSTSRSKLFSSKLSSSHMAEWNLFDVVNSVILKFSADGL